jgi:hypothetical protein
MAVKKVTVTLPEELFEALGAAARAAGDRQRRPADV